MKKYMKKIIVGIFAFALLFTAQSVFASTWNGASNDCRGISIANATTEEGYAEPCWTGTSVDADGGDTLNIRIYYHNTGSVTAENTRVRLSAPLGSSSTTKSFSGSISSDQGNLTLSTVTANLSSSQTLSFNSVKWYTNNTAVTRTNLLNGQDGSEILDEGLDIGDIAPGWETQGSLVISFHVGNNIDPVQVCRDTNATNYLGALPCIYAEPVHCTISNFSTSKTSIDSGESATLSWNTSDCVSVSISTIGYVNASGTRVVSPTATTTYVLTAKNSAGVSTTRSVTVYVNSAQICRDTNALNYLGALPCIYAEPVHCTISNFSAIPSSITKGDSSILTWKTNNCESVTITGLNGVQSSGSQKVYPTSTTTYKLTAVNPNAAIPTQFRSVIVYVEDVVSEMSGIINSSPSSCSISAGNSTCSSTLSWTTVNPVGTSAVTKLGSTVATGNNGSKIVSASYGSSTYYLYNNSRLLDSTTVSAYCASGSTWNGSYCKEDVIVNNDNCKINSFSASDTSIKDGEYTTLNWDTSDCTSVSITNLSYTKTSGSERVWPQRTTSYTLIANGYQGSTQSRSVTVYVDDDNNNSSCSIDSFTASDTSIEDGDEVELKWRTTGCDRVKLSDGIGYVDEDGTEDVEPDEDITYTLTAYDDDGRSTIDTIRIYVDEDGSNGSCTIDSFTTDDSYVDKGDSVKLKWRTTDCDDVSISTIGDVDEDGSETVYPYATTTYTLRASDDDRSRTKTVRINVGYVTDIDVYNTSVITTIATNISQTGGQINGIVTSSNSNNSNVYFEYGSTMNLGSRTSSKTTSGNSNFSDYLTNLSPNTIYYFQAVSEGSNGISRGAVEVFKTLGYVNTNTNTNTNTTNTTTTRRVVTQGNTVYGSASPVMLQIENRYQAIGAGDIIDYSVYYKNISGSTLTDPMVQVYVPEGIEIVNISGGTYSENDRTLSAPIEDLRPGEEGIIYLQARVKSVDPRLAQIPTTAVLIYTNPNGAQENAMAYVLNTPKDSNLLGASAFSGGLFGLGLIGWLFLIVLILLIILVARSLYARPKAATPTNTVQ